MALFFQKTTNNQRKIRNSLNIRSVRLKKASSLIKIGLDSAEI